MTLHLSEMEDFLEENNLTATRQAMDPLKELNLAQMRSILDHEEAFLAETLKTSLLHAHQSRVGLDKSNRKINKSDVRTAMLMLGEAAKNTSEQELSSNSKRIVVEICPYCGPKPGKK